jgi:hypothetical protein
MIASTIVQLEGGYSTVLWYLDTLRTPMLLHAETCETQQAAGQNIYQEPKERRNASASSHHYNWGCVIFREMEGLLRRTRLDPNTMARPGSFQEA